jgi:hypothetical protein
VLTLLLVLVVAVVSNWSSLTSSFTSSIIRNHLADYPFAIIPKQTARKSPAFP